jgi:hypothetical protein
VNILPLVFTFLIIFSCIAFTFLREVKSFHLIETTLHGYNRTERELSNTLARKAYKKATRDPATKKTDERNKAQKKAYFSMRTLFPSLENSKFNLTPLMKQQGEVKLHPLYEPLAELLRLLYGENLFKKEKKREKLEYRLIEEMLKKAQKLPESENLIDLHPEDPALKRIYYKMLKGTNQYTRKEGIPPLESYLGINKSDKAVSLSFAAPVLLEAFFGAEISSEILKMERQKLEESNKYYYFSKEDLTTTLMKNPAKSLLLSALEPYLDYSKEATEKKQIGGKDKLTGIAVKKDI